MFNEIKYQISNFFLLYKFYFILFVVLLFPVILKAQYSDSILKKCFLVEKSINIDRNYKFIREKSLNKNISDYFLNNQSFMCMLVWRNDNIYVIEINKDTSFIIKESNKKNINDTVVIKKIENLASKGLDYHMGCEENFKIFDYSHKFEGYWIKKYGVLTFVYYSYKYDFLFLKESSRLIISDLIDITQSL